MSKKLLKLCRELEILKKSLNRYKAISQSRDKTAGLIFQTRFFRRFMWRWILFRNQKQI
jgi:hypothetical protein